MTTPSQDFARRYPPEDVALMRQALSLVMDKWLARLKVDVSRLQDPEPPEWIRPGQADEWREFTRIAYAQLKQELAKSSRSAGDTPAIDAAWVVLVRQIRDALSDAEYAVNDCLLSIAAEKGSKALASTIAANREKAAAGNGEQGRGKSDGGFGFQ
jgi:hypothetical protein